MYVFYDTETTGLDKDYTQILQIGMIFTGDDLTEIGSLKTDSRVSPWQLPSPGSLLTTGFTPADLRGSKNSNYEMMQEINKWLKEKHWPLTFIGYNSLGYDEDILAQNFYQSLLPPHLTTSKNAVNNQSNGRADVMMMVQAAHLYMPKALTLEIMNNNKNPSPSMTLKNVAKQNGVSLSDDEAHDALNDIRATAGVARVIQKVAPPVWEQAIKLSTQDGVNQFLAEQNVFTYVRFMYGKAQKSGVMTSLVEREGSTTEVLFDLRNDPARFMNMSVDELKAVFMSKEKGANPFTLVRKDQAPVMMPMEYSDALLKPEDDTAVFEKRAKALKNDPAFLKRVAEAELLAKHAKYDAVDSVHDDRSPETMMNRKVAAPVQAKLDAWATEFREAADWHARAELTRGFRARFRDELAEDPSLRRFEKLAERQVFENAPEEMSEAAKKAIVKFIAGRLLNPETDPDKAPPYMTLAKARAELKGIEFPTSDSAKLKWKDVTKEELQPLKLYYTAIEKEIKAECKKYGIPVPEPVANSNEPAAPAPHKAPVNNPTALKA